MEFSGFLRCVVVNSYDIRKERTAFIFRVIVMFDMDIAVMRKQMCLLLSAMKEFSWKMLFTLSWGRFLPLLGFSTWVGQTPYNLPT
jgi:hypothetical protein